MKKKPAVPESDAIVDEKILEKAKLALTEERPPVSLKKCTICGGEAAPTSNENLCWVCRRLKISAWRDSDQQMTAQE